MSFYQPLGDDHYAPTESTESPWDSAMQHGGPPAALLGHLMRLDGLRLARITVDFLGPIPRRDFRVEVSPVKPGRLTSLNEASMVIDGRVAVSARAWHIAPGPQPPVVTTSGPVPPLPETSDEFRAFTEGWGYGRAIEWRCTRGGLDELGETHVWTRVTMPLIDGVELDGQDRALIVADSANGLSAELPVDKWLSIPPTMTTTLLRPATGDWVHMACRTILSDDGLGLAEAEVSDFDGKIGHVAQPLLVRAR
ncbi:thioesterase family protein [Actinoplanes sp. CA-030573]|uniref:thioesterase family protein n=1 Tax=Actinoplanes sp. CA-030573 TaxID=3239898 RepID=UPI003D91635C